MDTAALAVASDLAVNRFFRRRWAQPPPLKRERPGCAPRAKLEFHGSNGLHVRQPAEQYNAHLTPPRPAPIDLTIDASLTWGTRVEEETADVCLPASQHGLGSIGIKPGWGG
jgi:hypothetical protein